MPKDWPPSPDNEERLAAEMARLAGQRNPGVSSGQDKHPDGLFYCGTAPAWSNGTIRSILRTHGTKRRHIAWIDVHTGLGPYGHGEKIFGRHSEETTRRAKAWWGSDLIVSTAGESVSPRTIGHITGCAPEECPQAAITPTTLEYGTVPNPVVRRALRGEAWLAGHPDAPDALVREIRQIGARCLLCRCRRLEGHDPGPVPRARAADDQRPHGRRITKGNVHEASPSSCAP